MVSGWDPEEIASRAYQDLAEGEYVNLGIGLPVMLLGAARRERRDVIFQSENGVVGLAAVAGSTIDPDLIDAGKNPAALVTGGCFVSHAESFAMIRGGHLHVSVLGAYEVAVNGDFANWTTVAAPLVSRGGDRQWIPAVGGAVDLAAGAQRVVVLLRNAERDGVLRLLTRCGLPVTGLASVCRVYCDLGVFDPAGDHFAAIELAPGITRPYVEALFDRNGTKVSFA